jgi:plasmid replication initiation protein
MVVQANALVNGKQSLKTNSAKIIRSAIMQIKFEDNEIKPYIITMNEMCKLLGVTENNIYRIVKEITNDIMKNPVYVLNIENKKEDWIAIPWVKLCGYKYNEGFVIQLNEKLSSYLLELHKNYTQYPLGEVLGFKTVYSIRIYEILLSRIMVKNIPLDGSEVHIRVDELRELCGCKNIYKAFASFRAKVIDVAVEEINDYTDYRVSYSYEKNGKAVEGIVFNINTFNNLQKREFNRRKKKVEDYKQKSKQEKLLVRQKTEEENKEKKERLDKLLKGNNNRM